MRINIYDLKLNESKHPYIVKENGVNYGKTDNRFCNPQEIVTMLNNMFDMKNRAEESTYILAFNTNMQLLGIFPMTKGISNASLVGRREIFIRLFLCGANSFVHVHNHPSGNTQPSQADIKVVEKLKDASALVGIAFEDNIIVGDGYYSFKEKEML